MTKKCPKCNYENDFVESKCILCGAPFVSTITLKTEPKSPKIMVSEKIKKPIKVRKKIPVSVRIYNLRMIVMIVGYILATIPFTVLFFFVAFSFIDIYFLFFLLYTFLGIISSALLALIVYVLLTLIEGFELTVRSAEKNLQEISN